jgi:hypothetical protein
VIIDILVRALGGNRENVKIKVDSVVEKPYMNSKVDSLILEPSNSAGTFFRRISQLDRFFPKKISQDFFPSRPANQRGL